MGSAGPGGGTVGGGGVDGEDVLAVLTTRGGHAAGGQGIGNGRGNGSGIPNPPEVLLVVVVEEPPPCEPPPCEPPPVEPDGGGGGGGTTTGEPPRCGRFTVGMTSSILRPRRSVKKDPTLHPVFLQRYGKLLFYHTW